MLYRLVTWEGFEWFEWFCYRQSPYGYVLDVTADGTSFCVGRAAVDVTLLVAHRIKPSSVRCKCCGDVGAPLDYLLSVFPFI